MAFRINHIHLKSTDPERTASWYVQAFNFRIVSDRVRVFGDRFITCVTEDGAVQVNISGEQTGETLQPGDASPRYGLEHFAVDSQDLEADIKRLESLGATRLEGPIPLPDGRSIAFVKGPDDIRIELIQPAK